MTDHIVPLFPCYICKKRKPAEAFHNNRSRSTGLSAGCRECANKIRLGVPRRPKQVIPSEKRCPKCDQIKPAAQFYYTINRKDGLGTYCKECQSATAKARRRNETPEQKETRHLKHRQYGRLPKSVERRKQRYREMVADPVRGPKHKAQRRNYVQTNKTQIRVRKRGLTVAEYEAMLAEQNGRCAICFRLPGKKPLSIDHDHSTGDVRGLLCGTCNTALGMFRDSVKTINRAARYLIRHVGHKQKVLPFRAAV